MIEGLLTVPMVPASPTRRRLAEVDELLLLDDEAASELLLVRHGEPAEGRPVAKLSARGVEQAKRLADYLSSQTIDAIYTAPDPASLETANTVARALGITAQEMGDLRDIERQDLLNEMLTACYSTTPAELFRRRPRWDSIPGYEPSRDFRHRAIRAIESVVLRHPAQRIVVCTHASVMNAYVGMLLDIPRDLFFLPDHASVTTVRMLGDLHALRGLNDASHARIVGER